MTEADELLARLERTYLMPISNSPITVNRTISVTATTQVFYNPDGPEAADLIRRLLGEIGRLEGREHELHGQLMRMIDRWEAKRETFSPDPEPEIARIIETRVRLAP